MKNTICLFEDEASVNFLPLVYTRPVYDLKFGILTLRQKVMHRMPGSKFIFHSRKFLNEYLKSKNPDGLFDYESDNILFINGRIAGDSKFFKDISNRKDDFILKSNGSVAAAKLSKENIKKIVNQSSEFLKFDELSNVQSYEVEAELINFPWDIIIKNGSQIVNDFKLLTKNKKSAAIKFKSVEIINKKNVFIGKGTSISPFVVLDASDGPIYIGKNVKIMSYSAIIGPAFIGDNSVVKMHSAIYHNTSIGEMCKVGGEIENSLIHSYSNKQHEGFLGHSYLGSWINIGASTNNSDLKNNYASVDVHLNGKHIDTGSQFLGLIMGDHSKTAINTMLNTGTIIGVSCNIFGSGFPPKSIPSFTWGGTDFLRTYDISKSIEVAKIVMKRRNIEFSAAEENLLNAIFHISESERASRNIH